MEGKRVLIYGDSNTHGYRPCDELRFEKSQRWTGICQDLMGSQIELFNEGLNGRTTRFDEFGMAFRNGFKYVEPCIRTHMPLDMICVMLGSNDLKAQFQQSAVEIAASAATVLNKAREVVLSKYPQSQCQYVLMAPIEVEEALLDGIFNREFQGMRAVEESRKFAACFKAEAERNGFLFFDAGKYAKAGKEDGLHLDVENHRKLGEAFAAWLSENLI